MQANGSQYLYVNDKCEYWANGRSWMTSTGRLDAEGREQVEAALLISQLSSVDGTWTTSECFDADQLVVQNTSATLICECGCTNSNTPDSVVGISDRFVSLLDELTEKAEVFAGDADILVMEDSTLEGQDPIAWSEDFPDIASYVLSVDDATELVQNGQPLPGKHFDREYAYALRSEMFDYSLRYPERARMGSAVPIRSGNKTYGVYVLDVIPGLD